MHTERVQAQRNRALMQQEIKALRAVVARLKKEMEGRVVEEKHQAKVEELPAYAFVSEDLEPVDVRAHSPTEVRPTSSNRGPGRDPKRRPTLRRAMQRRRTGQAAAEMSSPGTAANRGGKPSTFLSFTFPLSSIQDYFKCKFISSKKKETNFGF